MRSCRLPYLNLEFCAYLYLALFVVEIQFVCTAVAAAGITKNRKHYCVMETWKEHLEKIFKFVQAGLGSLILSLIKSNYLFDQQTLLNLSTFRWETFWLLRAVFSTSFLVDGFSILLVFHKFCDDCDILMVIYSGRKLVNYDIHSAVI